jgi:hypothetical protein
VIYLLGYLAENVAAVENPFDILASLMKISESQGRTAPRPWSSLLPLLDVAQRLDRHFIEAVPNLSA